MRVLVGRQQGFSLIAAIFLLVVLAALGGYMVSISSSHHVAAANAVEGVRSYYAAEAGLEWAITRLELSNTAVDSATLCSSTVDGTTIDFTSGALQGFSVNITCSSTSHTELPDSYAVFGIESRSYKTALGINALGSLGYVSRYMKARVTDAP